MFRLSLCKHWKPRCASGVCSRFPGSWGTSSCAISMVTPCPVRYRMALCFNINLLTSSTHPRFLAVWPHWLGDVLQLLAHDHLLPWKLGSFQVRRERARGTRSFLSPKPRFPRTGNIHTSPPRYMMALSIFGVVFTCCIVDGGRISVGLTPLSTRPRHPTISNTPARVGRRPSTWRMHTTQPVTYSCFSADRSLSSTCAPSRSWLPHIRPHCSSGWL